MLTCDRSRGAHRKKERKKERRDFQFGNTQLQRLALRALVWVTQLPMGISWTLDVGVQVVYEAENMQYRVYWCYNTSNYCTPRVMAAITSKAPPAAARASAGRPARFGSACTLASVMTWTSTPCLEHVSALVPRAQTSVMNSALLIALVWPVASRYALAVALASPEAAACTVKRTVSAPLGLPGAPHVCYTCVEPQADSCAISEPMRIEGDKPKATVSTAAMLTVGSSSATHGSLQRKA